MLFTPEDYLEMIGDWQDPNPAPVLETYDGITVVRDDLLNYGSKIRFADYFVWFITCHWICTNKFACDM